MTTIVLPELAHVWDVRTHEYLGHGDRFELSLNLRPRFLAILRSNPGRMELQLDPGEPKPVPGKPLKVVGEVEDAVEGVQAIHVPPASNCVGSGATGSSPATASNSAFL